MGKRSREEDYAVEDRLPQTQPSSSSPTQCPYCSTMIYGYVGFQNHFLTFHEYQCLSCDKIFPSRYILELHIDEYHNPFSKLHGTKVREGKEIDEASILLRCLCETCDMTFNSSQLRTDHLIEHHNYPETFPFNITSDGIASTP
ncbi:ZNF511 [Candida theae]|uniref:ZNF511 n=1 Tax=Candida theae TaxID=1198502 RepID=A0AAD5BI32_9ASCO|nr:ZNF511 [Candida theae]KAI5964512.1 ZNF511 [Candida theae]